MTQIETPRWSVDMFRAFWAHPDPALVGPEIFAPDVVGRWPDGDVHGFDDYVGRLADILAELPDLRLEVVEHADNGEHTFIRWVMHAKGPRGWFQIPGVDRVRLVDGLIAENLIIFDRVRFRELSGLAI